eukprot:m.52329 g.52329  ORF g.52329 m.52329 type:complete len:117 (-) comp13496_c2_seq10:151-501(-)
MPCSLAVWQFFGDLNLDTVLSGDTANCTVSVPFDKFGSGCPYEIVAYLLLLILFLTITLLGLLIAQFNDTYNKVMTECNHWRADFYRIVLEYQHRQYWRLVFWFLSLCYRGIGHTF